jgi:hypothetical protein
MRFLAIGSDLRMMTERAQQVLRTVKPEGEGKDVARY